MADSLVITVLTESAQDKPPGLETISSDVELRYAWDEASLTETLPGTDVMMVTDFRTEALQAAWHHADRLRWIHATSAGVDALMFPELIDSEVVVTNARGIFDRTIAEYVLCSILMFAKDFPHSLRLQQARRWQHRDTERAQGNRVLVVGAGSIGRQIAQLTGAIGMEVHGIARRARSEDPDFIAIHSNEELMEQLPLADYVVIAAPLTPATKGLFDEAAFKAMKSSARLINIGRGPIVVTESLIRALEGGDIAGAGLDVFEEEPLPADHPLWGMDNVLITAHMAGDFIGWRKALTDQFLDNFNRWRDGLERFNEVDKKAGYVPGR